MTVYKERGTQQNDSQDRERTKNKGFPDLE